MVFLSFFVKFHLPLNRKRHICLRFGKLLKLVKGFGSSFSENTHDPIFQYRSLQKQKYGLISIYILLFDTNTRMFYEIKLNKWLNNNIQQYACTEKTVNYWQIFQMTFQYGGQREKKDELPNNTAMVHTKPRTRPNANVHFAWSLAGVLWPPELAFSPTW